MRTLLRRMKRESWKFERTRFDVDDKGIGTALYQVDTGTRQYTLVAFAHDLPADQRSDRVIATAWDTTFALHDGVPTDSDIERLRANVPLQEAGRVSHKELTLSRANRSVRLWSSVIDALASGYQPDAGALEEVGYLMRTTAVYGSGKFGAADREAIADRPELMAPFQAEMLTVYLIRWFVVDLVEHMAKAVSPNAVAVSGPLRRGLGIGNSTGLGMAPFLINHPRLINNWIQARETALGRVRAVERATENEISNFQRFVAGARTTVDSWYSQHPVQQAKVAKLSEDLDLLDQYLAATSLTGTRPWDELFRWASATLSVEGQELVVSLLMEPYGELVDSLVETMHADESSPARINGSVTLSAIQEALVANYGWALQIDWSSRVATARAWYVSEEKLEPRLGERYQEDVGRFEQPLQPGRDAAAMYHQIDDWDGDQTLSSFLRAHPEHRHTARRLAISGQAPYAEIRDNTIDAHMMPIDLLRAKLSFFGATHFDPRSDRWVRICMFRGAPLPDDLATADPDAWTYFGPDELSAV